MGQQIYAPSAEYSSPAIDAAAVTPDDANDITRRNNQVVRGLYVGTGGNVTVRMRGETTTVLFSNVPAGSILPVMVDRVMATGTTASNIVALF